MKRLSHGERVRSVVPFLYTWVIRNWSSASRDFAETQAVGFLCLLALFPFMALCVLVADWLGADFVSPFVILPAFLPVCWAIQRYLIGKKVGIRFEKNYHKLDRSKPIG
ncbi:MAG: hypothetical protein ABI471_05250 [Sphingomonas bacterium]